MHTLILPHEPALLQAGATLLVRPASDSAYQQLSDYGFDRTKIVCPFPAPDSECEATYSIRYDFTPSGAHLPSVYETIRFRIAGLEVRRVNELSEADALAINPAFPSHEEHYSYSRPLRALRRWWTTTFPDHDFDSAWAWVATLEPQ